MAAPTKITEEAILTTALNFAREKGLEGLNARALAGALGCSTQPIFKNFASMGALRQAVLERALEEYHRFMEGALAASELPPYKAMGLAYIDFARAEPSLFRLLFMRRREGAEGPEAADWPAHTARAGASAGLTGSSAELFHLEMWALVHGIAVMYATGYLDLDRETVSRMLTDAFLGVKTRWEEKANECH